MKGEENNITIFIQSIYLLYIVHILISYEFKSSIKVWYVLEVISIELTKGIEWKSFKTGSHQQFFMHY